MVKQSKKTNPMLISLIKDLKKTANEKESMIWKDVALRLEKPSKNWPEIHLDRINRYINEKEIALVPGKVLSDGNLNKKVTIAAWSFSQKAQDKIKKAGGKTITIQELMKTHPDGKNIRILG